MHRHNLKLKDCLDQNPCAYLGLTVPDFPNFFFIFGPNTVLAHSSVIWMIECQVMKLINTNYKSSQMILSPGRVHCPDDIINGLSEYQVS